MNRAEELAQQRFGVSYDDLSNGPAMLVWRDAEVQVQEELNEAADRARDDQDITWFDELELERRLGN